MNPIPLLILALAWNLAVLRAQTPAQTQIEVFTKEIEAAWSSGADAAFEALYHKEGAEQYQIDAMISLWSEQKKYLPDGKLVVEAFHDLAQARKKAKEENKPTGIFTITLDLWEKPKMMNGREYIPNLPVAGILEVSIRNEKGNGAVRRLPVGITGDNCLRFVMRRPKDGKE